MKITNLRARCSKQLKFEPKDVNAREQGITKRLLEKYKPKYLCNVEGIGERNRADRVA